MAALLLDSEMYLLGGGVKPMAIPKTVNRLQAMLRSIGREHAEIGYYRRIRGLTRFAANHIHQNTVTDEHSVWIRIIVNGRAGLFVTDRLDQDSIAFAAQRAEDIARTILEPDVPASLPTEMPLADTLSYDECTAQAQPLERAMVLSPVFRDASAKGATVAGALSTSEETLCIVNTEGVQSYQTWTRAELNLLATREPLCGRSYWVGNALRDLPTSHMIEEALALVTPEHPLVRSHIRPRTCAVVLDHMAVGQLIGFLGWMAFGAKQYLERHSPFWGRLGKRVCSSRITIWDDGRDPDGMPRVFDYEGVARKRVMLIERGVATGLVTDSTTARLLQRPNTGHAPMPTSTEGPQAENLFMKGGKSSLVRLIRSTRDGIYVRNFHYVNIVDPMTTTITGMTRDGTFRIRNGKLSEPLPNLRFTVDVLHALRQVTAMSEQTRRVEGVTGVVVVPAIKVREFPFTGVTKL